MNFSSRNWFCVLSFVVGFSGSLYGQGPFGPGRPLGGGFSNGSAQGQGQPKLRGVAQELGKASDRFLAWRIAHLEGAEWFTKEQEDLRESFREMERKIREAVTEDRLDEKKGRELLVTLVKIGKDANLGAKATEVSLENLNDALQQASENNAKAGTLTPKLNQIQWLVSEILFYGSHTSTLTSGKVSSLKRKLLANEEKEKEAKQDGKLTEREIESLEESVLEIWGGIVKSYRRHE